MKKIYALILLVTGLLISPFLSLSANVEPIERRINLAQTNDWIVSLVETDSDNYGLYKYTLPIQKSDLEYDKMLVGINTNLSYPTPNVAVYQQMEYFRVYDFNDPGNPFFFAEPFPSVTTEYIEVDISAVAETSEIIIDFEITFYTTITSGFNEIAQNFDFNHLKTGNFIYAYNSPESYYDLGYSIGFEDGYDEGYNDGLASSADYGQGWIMTLLSGFSMIFGITLLPGVTIGTLIGIPIVFKLVLWIIGVIRGRG